MPPLRTQRTGHKHQHTNNKHQHTNNTNIQITTRTHIDPFDGAMKGVARTAGIESQGVKTTMPGLFDERTNENGY